MEGPQGAVVTLLVVPKLGGNEQLFARRSGAGDRITDALLVPVDRCGIHIPLADVEGV